MTTEPWQPAATHELTTMDGRVLRYCCYGPLSGLPVVSLPGTPGTRWERPDVVRAIEQAGLRVAVLDRPGYGGSARRPGRTVADVAGDVRAIADVQSWARFAVTGFSGGGPHALAGAALLADRVTCCAAIASPAPPDAPGTDFFADRTPAQNEDFRLALRGEQMLRPYLAARAGDVLAGPDTGDPGRATRIRAMYLGLDGWADDMIALARPWGFDVTSINVPVGLWYGAQDTRIPREQTGWLLAHMSTARGYEHPGGHDPGDASYRTILRWIATGGAIAPP